MLNSRQNIANSSTYFLIFAFQIRRCYCEITRMESRMLQCHFAHVRGLSNIPGAPFHVNVVDARFGNCVGNLVYVVPRVYDERSVYGVQAGPSNDHRQGTRTRIFYPHLHGTIQGYDDVHIRLEWKTCSTPLK